MKPTAFRNYSYSRTPTQVHQEGTEYARPKRADGCWRVLTTRAGYALPVPTQCRQRARYGKACCFAHRAHEEAAQAFKASQEAAA